MSLNEVSKKLNLNNLNDNVWNIIGCCAIKGDGLFEGLKWVSNALKNSKKWTLMNENNKKSILLISGFMRKLNKKYKFYIPSIVAHIIFEFYQNKKLYYKVYKFYGELNQNIID